MNERLVTKPLTLPERVWWRLASVADERGVEVEDLLASAVLEIVPEFAPPAPPVYVEGFTGLPGQRLDVLAAELSAARRARRRARERAA